MMTYKKPRFSLFMVGLFMTVLGVLMLLNPISMLIQMLVATGMVFCVMGAILFFDAWKLPDFLSMRSTMIFEAFMMLVLGLILVFGDRNLTLGVLTYLFLFVFILSAFVHLQFSVMIVKPWLKVISILLNIILIAFSVYMFINPKLAQEFIMYCLAFGIMSSGINRMLIGLFDL
ncbi:DUF308 domain-containing protein [Erysipelothrix urinaevulpis]|uniref:DUF308 domain-containing protein n=1 Tax=Erysipelothrix urinaevulpis TaxID=2683717 RepID=UPI001356E0CD|nr:DUF308 domain-containing protein [Erysipelothrix urinaevulpis]